MNRIVRSKLIEIARKRGGYIHYQQLANECNLGLFFQDNPSHRKEIGRILGEISAFEEEHRRPLLSSLVISQGGDEGYGFFKLCEELGYGNWKKLKNDPAFPSIQMNRCYDFWQNDDNYTAFRET